jgi:hypothetical protein
LNQRLTDKVVCLDKDGIQRKVKSKEPFYQAGFYGRRTSTWPDKFEESPWQPPAAQKLKFAGRLPEHIYTRDLVFGYPAGTIATKTGDTWLVAIPIQGVSGDQAYTVRETAGDPAPMGAKIVSNWRFKQATGTLAWYETIPAIVGFGLAGLAGVGTVIWLRRR